MIAKAVKLLMADKSPITVPNASAHLPEGFDLDATELRGVYSELIEVTFVEPEESLRNTWAPETITEPVEATGDMKADPITGMTFAAPPPKPLEKIEPPYANAEAQPHSEPAKVTPEAKISRAEALANVQQAATAITDNRFMVRNATARVQTLRGKLHEAVSAFQAGGPRYTALQQARDYQAASQAERARRADVPPELRNKYGSAANYARKRMVNGPGRGSVTEAGRARSGFVVPGSPAHAAQIAARAAKLTGPQS